MEIIRTATSQEVYSTLKNSNHLQVYDQLTKIAPAESAFLAIYQKSYDGSVWKHAEGGWIGYSEADDLLRGLVLSEIERHKSALRASVSAHPELSKIIENVLSSPGNEYYYYRIDDLGQLEVLMTGWGFKKPVRREPKGVVVDDPREKFQSVSVCFVDFGTRVPNRTFKLELRKMKRTIERVTDDNGLFLVGEQILVGSVLPVIDTVTGKTFELIVQKDQDIYECDVTLPKLTFVAFLENGQRTPGRSFTITFEGQDISCQTDSTGLYQVGDHLPSGTYIRLKDLTTEREFGLNILEGIEVYEFDVTPTPVPDQFTYVALLAEGQRVADRDFIITYEGREIACRTDNTGIYKLGNHLVPGIGFHLKDIETGKEFDFNIVEGKDVYEFDVTADPEPDKFSYVAFYADGRCVADRDFILTRDGQEIACRTDNTGLYQLGNHLAPGSWFHLKDVKTGKEFDFNIVDDQDIYKFDVTEAVPEPEKMVRLRILDPDGALVPDLQVRVTISKDIEFLVKTDETGCVQIPASKFIPGKKFKVSFEYDKPKKTEQK